MKKKNGFIATSLIYSFFLIFITLFLTIIADYLQQKVLLSTIEQGIKDELNNSKGIRDFNIGDKLVFQFTSISEYSKLICSSYNTFTPTINCNTLNYNTTLNNLYIITNFNTHNNSDNDNKINVIELTTEDKNTIIYLKLNDLRLIEEKADTGSITLTGVLS